MTTPQVAPATDETRPGTEGLEVLLAELLRLREYMLKQADDLASLTASVDPAYRMSAVNLAHYLGLRQHDVRLSQEALAAVGLSSLGRCEGHALASVDAVVRALYALLDRTEPAPSGPLAVSSADGRARLEANTTALLGPQPDERSVRIMVTLPSEAATDYGLARALLASGMDCARINCAHDDAGVWAGMVTNIRRAAVDVGRSCRVLVDLAGPKLRTGDLPPAVAALHWRPQRGALGAVREPAHIWLTAKEQPIAAPGSADACVSVPERWMAQLVKGDCIKLRDARAKRRTLTVTKHEPGGWWADADQSAYVSPRTKLRIRRRRHGAQPVPRGCRIDGVPAGKSAVVLRPGDTLILTSSAHSEPQGIAHRQGEVAGVARIPWAAPSNLDAFHEGEPIWFDDGKIGGRIRSIGSDHIEVEITQAKSSGSKLRGDRSINLPDSEFERPALTPKDLDDLAFIAQHADLVGLSFAESSEAIGQVVRELTSRTSRSIGIVLKIETRRGFERLPELLLSAMRHYPVGVMIARGDLAVECGYERLAEVQEEMLWLCEAAHLPVIWATQVLDQLTRTGQPSRAEVTDAAMGERAECVMLNKGPHVVEAVRTLSDILSRMQAHQHKKQSLFRELQVSQLSWSGLSDAHVGAIR